MNVLIFWPAGQDGAEFFFEVKDAIERLVSGSKVIVLNVNVGMKADDPSIPELEAFDAYLFVWPALRSDSTLLRFIPQVIGRMGNRPFAAVTQESITLLIQNMTALRHRWHEAGVRTLLLGSELAVKYIASNGWRRHE